MTGHSDDVLIPGPTCLPVHCQQVRLRFTIDKADVEIAKSILDHCLKKNVGEGDGGWVKEAAACAC